jgi:hypothetical protein
MKLLTKLLLVFTMIFIIVALSVQSYFAYLNLTGNEKKVEPYVLVP